jgi:hypothetical protein
MPLAVVSIFGLNELLAYIALYDFAYNLMRL